MTEAVFDVEVRPEHARAFAELSGDWNPLHTDAKYAANTPYRRPILHGAFSAGLVSRMAGMHIPGRDCLLHSIQLKFLEPIIPPAKLVVRGRLLSESGDNGRVEVIIADAGSGLRLVSAGYEFSRHAQTAATLSATPDPVTVAATGAVALVTGASGGVGSALARRLGAVAVAFSSAQLGRDTESDSLARIDLALAGRPLSAIVHCGWPAPDNTRLMRLPDTGHAVSHHVADPLSQCISLARLLTIRGAPDALLLLVGSTASEAGRHNFRSPLYSLSKSLLPLLSRVLAVELGGSGRRCVTVVFDVVDGGMSDGMSAQARVAHKARIPSGTVPGVDDIAEQIAWVLSNRSSLLSGATITLSGGALP